MGQETGIQWTDHTFNPWRGCTKVSEGCKNCYAERLVTTRHQLPVWGAQAERKVAAESSWQHPMRWNRAAERDGVRRRVFCASLADVFEDYTGPSKEEIRSARSRLFVLIEKTPALDWLLLTKRPENVLEQVPPTWREKFPPNVWIGCTIENQARAVERILWLLEIPSAVRFVSYEPALEMVDFTRIQIVEPVPPNGPGVWLNALTGHVEGPDDVLPHHVDWVIVGGESGPGARPFNPAWADRIVNACRHWRVPVFVKQMGSNPTLRDGSGWGPIHDKKGAEMAEWPAQLRMRQFPGGVL